MNHRETSLAALVARLAADYEARSPSLRCEVVETHISIVLLAGERAYKFKKAVDLGFVDFTTLERRRHYCEREVALNARFAPSIYLDVVPITLERGEPRLGGDGEVVEYAVAMRRFHDEERLDRAIEAGRVGAADFERLGSDLADWHAAAEPAAGDSPYGTWDTVREQVARSFDGLGDAPGAAALAEDLSAALAAHRETLLARRAAGHVRDCHGDLHLANLVLHDGRVLPFDCIEFDDALRVVDTLSDLAFPVMDLDLRSRHAWGTTLMNAWLSTTGEYEDVPLLAPFCAYRSVVRAKVAALQAEGGDGDARERSERHLGLARRYLSRAGPPALVVTHGCSGSGKTWFARALAADRGFVHLRSDVERRRLAGLGTSERTGSAVGEGLYAAAATRATYDWLHDQAAALLAAGWGVIVDATFLDRGARERFAALAARSGARFTIARCDAPPDVLRERVRARLARGDDASEATPSVLERQLETREPLAGHELEAVLEVPPGGLPALGEATLAALGCGRPGAA